MCCNLRSHSYFRINFILEQMCGKKRKFSQSESSEPAFVSIRPSKVPKLFHSGSFYQSLDTEDNSTIQVPFGVTKSNQNIRNNKELTTLLSGLRFWGVDAIPDKVIAKLVLERRFNVTQTVATKFIQCFPIIQTAHRLQMKSTNAAMEEALKLRDLVMVRILATYGVDFPEHACSTLAMIGNRECLKLAHTKGIRVTAVTMYRAVKAGNVETLNYLHEVGCKVDQHIMGLIAVSGGKGCLQYALDHNFPHIDLIPAAVVVRLGVDMVRQFHQRGSSLRDLLPEAAGANSLDCMKYALEHGAAWTPQVVYKAAEKKSMDCLHYAIDQGCPYDPEELAKHGVVF